MRGEAGTEVTLHIERYEAPKPVASNEPPASAAPTPAPSPGASGVPDATPSPKPRTLLDEFDVTIVRAKIQRREVTSRELAGGTVGYVSLAGFSSAGAAELRKALEQQLDDAVQAKGKNQRERERGPGAAE